MIKASELRYKNLFILNGLICEVAGFHPNDRNQDDIIVFYKRTSVSDDSWKPINSIIIDPIPLTPEWLERCGLIEKGSSLPGVLKVTGEGNFTIEANEEGKLKYYLPFQKKIEIKYVHQVQNIYLDLTGEELNVKL